MEQLEDKIKQYRNATLAAVAGMGISITGFNFDYGVLDETFKFGGGILTGLNLRDSLRYTGYLLRMDRNRE